MDRVERVELHDSGGSAVEFQLVGVDYYILTELVHTRE